MPCYLFRHPDTEEVIEVIQSIKDRHEHVDEEGVVWSRVWTVPNASVDSINDGTKDGFMKYTQNKHGTIGDLWMASKEASEKREQRHGVDEIKENNHKKYSKRRKGKIHPDARAGKNSTLEI